MSIERARLEAAEGWMEVKVPPLRFPAGWEITIIPPFAGAMARFQATNTHGGQVSVYFDDRDALGVVGQPYWEIYPIGGATVADDEDTQRFLVGEEDRMIEAIGAVGDPVRGAIVGLGGEA